jgi:hypothetical protein
MGKFNLRDKFLSLGLLLLTTFSPIVSVIPVHAADMNSDNAVTSNTETENTDSISLETSMEDGTDVIVTDKKEVDSCKKADDMEFRGLSADKIRDKGGGLVFNIGVAIAQPFLYGMDDLINSDYLSSSKADNKFDVATYSITMDSGANVEQKNIITSFVRDIICDADKRFS